MLEVYGQLIRAQLQISATDLSPTATGLIYFNTTTGIKWHNGTVWKIAADLDSSQSLSNKNLGSATNVLTGATAGSFVNTGTITLPTVTGTLALVADITTTALTMASKTLVQPLIDNYFDINEEAAPGTPAANTVRIYAKADGKIYKKDDTGVESEVGSGAGSSVKNYLQDWFDGTRAIAVSATTLGATSNRTTDQSLWARSTVAGLTIENNAVSPLRPLGDFLINSSASTIASFVESPLFVIDSADVGKTIIIEFDLTGIAAITNYDIVVVRYNSAGTYQETISVAGNASTGTPSSAQLPVGTATFSGFFIPSGTSTDQYALRLRKVAAVDDDFQIDSIFVGKQVALQGAIVTQFSDASTPTSGWFVTGPTNVTTTVKQARIGSEGHIRYAIIATGTSAAFSELSINLPSNLTIDTTAINKTSNGRTPVGKFELTKPGVGNFSGVVYYEGTSLVCRYLGSTALPTQVSNTSPVNWDITTAATSINIEIIVPVSQWQSGTTTLAERAVEEYAWNSSATATSDTTSFAYGPDGANIRAFAPTGNNNVEKRVRFQTPILTTDRLSLEINNGSGWTLASDSIGGSSVNDAGTTSYGQFIRPTAGSNTDVGVFFNSLSNGLSAWSGITNFKWRVRKVSGGASVGFPIAPANITLVNTSDNYSGNTKLGLMQYAHGTTYNGGIAPTITLAAGGGTLILVTYSSLIPYQISDGTWRMKFNINVQLSATARTSVELAINGVSYASVGNISFNGGFLGASSSALAFTSTSTLVLNYASATAVIHILSGDVPLASKPNWAY